MKCNLLHTLIEKNRLLTEYFIIATFVYFLFYQFASMSENIVTIDISRFWTFPFAVR
jgi:hypothetical protein